MKTKQTTITQNNGSVRKCNRHALPLHALPIFTLTLLLTFSTTAQNQQWFTYTDGRPVSEVEEYNGTYWISTLGGLVYFTDPSEVYHLDQNNSPINTNEFSAMHIDKMGGIWLGTSNGEVYSYINGKWTFYSDAKTRKHSVLRVDKILIDHKQQVWLTRRYMDPLEKKPGSSGITARAYGEDYELVKLEGNYFSRQEVEATSVYDISLGEDNSLLLATNTGLKLLQNGLKSLETPEKIDISQPYTTLQDKQGHFWVSSARWTWKYINDKWEVQEIYHSGDKVFSVHAERFETFNNEQIAINSYGEIFMGNSENWKQFDREKLKKHFGKNINLEYTYITRNGEIFANTRMGLLWLKEDEIIPINTSNSPLRGSSIYRIHIDEDNAIHFKSDRKNFTINKDEWTSEQTDKYWWNPAFRNLAKEDQEAVGDFVLKQMKAHFSNVVATRDGSIWIATTKGLVEHKKGESTIYDKSNSQLPSNGLFGIAQAPDDALWLGLDSGVVEWKENKATYHPLKSAYGGAQYKNIAFHPDGRVFVGAMDGLRIYDGKQWTHINKELPRNKTINDMVVDMNGTLWLGTYGSGLLRYDKKGVQNFTVENSGLSNNVIFSMDVDRYNNIWIGTQEGLCVLNESGLLGQVAQDGASPYFQIQENSSYSVSTKAKGENTTDLKLHFRDTKNIFTEISLFPNPTSARFTVKLIAITEKEVNYELFNLNGQLIKSHKARGKNQEVEMDLTDHPSATYLLRIRQGDVVLSQRVVKL